MHKQIGKYKFDIYMSVKKMVEVEGVNSNLPDGHHILMWDFDEEPLSEIHKSLEEIQIHWHLPSIYIVSSGKQNHFHAYCLVSMPYPLVMYILASTKHICDTYFKFGVLRGFWTLRITNQKGNFKLVAMLKSDRPEITGLCNLETVKYWTKEG